MADTSAYRATIASLERDLAQTEKHAENLRTAITAIRAIINLGAATSDNGVAAQPVDVDPRLRTATMLDAATIALEKAGRPLRVREIFEILMAGGYPYPKGFEVFKGSMTPTLDRHPRFAKTGPGLYTLSGVATAREPVANNNLALGA